MATTRLDASSVGLPAFDVSEEASSGGPDDGLNLFQLSSHTRARQALAFGLGITTPGFNIFVLGEPNSGRMSATMRYLESYVADKPPADDWLYLNNFRRPHKPRRVRLPAGQGRHFKNRLARLLPALRGVIRQALEAPEYAAERRIAQNKINARMDTGVRELRRMADLRGLTLEHGPQGYVVGIKDPKGGTKPFDRLSEQERARVAQASKAIGERLREVTAETSAAGIVAKERLQALRRQVAEQAVARPLEVLGQDFAHNRALARWLDELRRDIPRNLDQFLAHDETRPRPSDGDVDEATADGDEADTPRGRYAVNLLVDHADDTSRPVVLEPNPTHRRLFGSIEYRSVSGVLETDFTMIRAGALHRANGGVLVLRAEDLARDPWAWSDLKGALRDREIRVEEPHSLGALSVMGAPEPKPIPLDAKVVIVGSPHIYYQLFSLDPDFQTLFKVKADIDPDLAADDGNLATYARLIHDAVRRGIGRDCDAGAVSYLLGQSARWAGYRNKLSARFELIDAVLSEAADWTCKRGDGPITAADVKAAIDGRRARNARVEDRAQEHIATGTVMIDTAGTAVGQVNALTVLDLGDYAFGRPARVTARVYVGKLGIINIERMVALGGPIQQKGVMILQGFLNGLFARRFPLSFSASITFEQTYGQIEGDSASLAELAAVLSALAEAPTRQDIAITGSVNQTGAAQAVGGVTQKAEGFYRTCAEAGLTGSQGVIVPAANAVNLALRDEVCEAVAAERFHLWTVATIDDAAELLTGLPVGKPDADGGFPPDTLYGRVHARLAEFDRILTERAAHRD
jgi:predicted ATP-dependent protease